ncbi:prolyl oligopeptidase family serine peptidase [Ilumatobacter nonamiensis]|uniref:prolyl oligopeptidase family serine peptidase n=1 Tax=Ilumatobacter nonamiensis TaxID=467093 RepID=UPI00034C727F|nr:prolyl oligopeptidase family serine peptidase [Ilumatobacter nonamiensis]
MTDADEFQWLEDVEGSDALEWVRERNERAEASLFTSAEFEWLRTSTLAVLEADDRIAYPTRHRDVVHNFWTDADHRRGLLRRTSWDDYRGGDPAWETILDVDALGADEGESWVFHGASVRRPDRRRALIDLSPGGSDASVTREFDLVENRFVPEEEGGFVRPLAKGGLTWIDDDTVYVTSDFGAGSLTRSGYPRTVRRWRRGTPIEASEIVFEGEESDVAVGVSVSTLPGFEHHVFERAPDFFTSRTAVLRDGETVELAVPDDAEVRVHERWIFVVPRSDLEDDGAVHPAGSLLVSDLDGFLDERSSLSALFVPSATASLVDFTCTRNLVVLDVLDDVRNVLSVATPPSSVDGDWMVEPLTGLPDVWSLSVSAVDADARDDIWLIANDFLTPEQLYVTSLTDDGPPELLRQAPPRFDAAEMAIEQHFAPSADGTRIPYFVVGTREALASTDGSQPTLLSGYGGFEVPRVAAYSPVVGRSWLVEGGVYVLANIRGGGEYGPAWHRAGRRDQRPRVYEDFEAVARALIERGITSPARLGITGGSNGGLLVGNMYLRTPELFGAVVCQVPLLDMQRYHLLLAGASWMAEYGDPDDPSDWSYLQGYSPYHLADALRGTDIDLPPILLTTSTRDDRVHPGHARKMAAKLEREDRDVTYWENIEGGHGGAADAAQQATMQALIFTFLRDRLMKG